MNTSARWIGDTCDDRINWGALLPKEKRLQDMLPTYDRFQLRSDETESSQEPDMLPLQEANLSCSVVGGVAKKNSAGDRSTCAELDA